MAIVVPIVAVASVAKIFASIADIFPAVSMVLPAIAHILGAVLATAVVPSVADVFLVVADIFPTVSSALAAVAGVFSMVTNILTPVARAAILLGAARVSMALAKFLEEARTFLLESAPRRGPLRLAQLPVLVGVEAFLHPLADLLPAPFTPGPDPLADFRRGLPELFAKMPKSLGVVDADAVLAASRAVVNLLNEPLGGAERPVSPFFVSFSVRKGDPLVCFPLHCRQ